MFAYHAALGSNPGHVYAPWSILRRTYTWYSRYPDESMKAGSMGMLVATMGLPGVAVAKVVTSNSSKANESLHGSARWAEKKDIQAAGLLPRERNVLEIVTGKAAPMAAGVYVGGRQDKDGHFFYLRHSGPEHVDPCADALGQGRRPGSADAAVVGREQRHDRLEGRVMGRGLGWRQKHAKNKVLRFEPAGVSGGVCRNPPDEIRFGSEYEPADVQNLVTLIVDPDGKGLDSHWQKTAFALLVGVILHALYKARDEGGVATLPSVDATPADPNRDVSELWMEMATYGHVDGRNHQAVGSAARDMMDRPEEEAGSALSTAKSYLTFVPRSRGSPLASAGRTSASSS